jgi:histidine ammonia-lyase
VTVERITLDGATSAADVAAIAHGARVELDADALVRVAASRDSLATLIASETPVYGITTGFGALVSTRVDAHSQRALQVNLLRSHAAGTGADLPREAVRAAMAVRVNGLLRGHSGVRPLVLEQIAALLNGGYAPRVPRTGSLGASGDLAPSAHAFLPLLGEGEVHDADGRVLPAAEALRALGLAPLELAAKEGLALINGTHFMSGIGALVTLAVQRLLDTADVVAAATVDALRGATPAFDPRVHALRDIPGQARSAANVVAALAGSARVRGAGDGGLQDAYALRCIPQVHGAAREGFGFFARIVRADLDAVTDNPLVFGDPPEVISAGNFHGQALALAFDTLRLSLADLGSFAERRVFRLVSPSLNGGLPAFLSPDPGLSSGYMIAQYVAAALVSELRALAHPVSVDSVPTSDNQEDHVSMGMTAALMTLDAVDRVERILGYEALCACQALDRDPGAPGDAVAELHAVVRERVPELVEDRPPAADLDAVLGLVRGGALAELLVDARREVAA